MRYMRLCSTLPTLLFDLTSVIIQSHLDRLVHLQLTPNYLLPLELRDRALAPICPFYLSFYAIVLLF
jgi:hypothetical protein